MIKKILFVSSLYYPHVGGIETIITELSQIYATRGISSTVLTKRWPENLSEFERYGNIDIYRVKSARTEEDFMQVVESIEKMQEGLKADVIHVIGVRRPLPLIALMLARIWKVPIICSIAGIEIPDHTDPLTQKVWDEGKGIVPESLLQVDMIHSFSKSLSFNLIQTLPEAQEPRLIYAGIDFSILRDIRPTKQDVKYVVSVRRLEPSKGVSVLIKAFALVANRYPDLELVIAGDGSERDALESLVKRLGLTNRVSFLGTVGIEKTFSLLKSAIMTVLPSISEGGGLVNVEAQAVGCPVVASRTGGIPEYVKDKESGLLFESKNEKDLADKMMSLLNDEALRKKIIQGGFEHAKRFDWETLAPQYILMYEECAQTAQFKEYVPWSVLTGKLWKKLRESIKQ